MEMDSRTSTKQTMTASLNLSPKCSTATNVKMLVKCGTVIRALKGQVKQDADELQMTTWMRDPMGLALLYPDSSDGLKSYLGTTS